MDKRNAAADLALCEAATIGPWYATTNQFASEVTADPQGSSVEWICQLWYKDEEVMQNHEANARFIAEAREALPYWIERAQAAEEKLKWVNRDAAEMHDDWIDSSARATAAAAEIERLRDVAESLYQIIQRGDLTSFDLKEAERVYVGTGT